ncbi:MAG: hypothetical protein H7A53_01675 [Akkermansiaceae bacterium]|nr:hypothetical protein [Akkermansiaceae bacterium]MCP5549596.1 hypothetical protein [Akkermansiaceae bacterium]
MDDGKEHGRGQLARWLLARIFTSPAAWIGAAAGTGVGIAASGPSTTGGAIGMGTMAGLAVGGIVLALVSVVRRSFENSRRGLGAAQEAREGEAVAALERDGLDGDAALLRKIFAERDAVIARAPLENPGEATSTLELVGAMAEASRARAEDLHDLERRLRDPLLDSPPDAEAEVAAIRSELRAAFRAMADTHTRLRRGESLVVVDFLAETESSAPSELATLTRRIEGERDLSDRVAERLKWEGDSRVLAEESPSAGDATDVDPSRGTE